jgi:23S rRNA (adenine2503-C2)-methyltransferase
MNDEEIKKYLSEKGEKDFRWRQIRSAIYNEGCLRFDQISNIPLELRKELDDKFRILPFDIINIYKGKDGNSYKAVLELADKEAIETVLISPKKRIWTACVSSQVGCPLGCLFCATGKRGFKRNLKAPEISGQVLFWKGFLAGNFEEHFVGEKQVLSNVVYMGMGEPFLNWNEVSESLRRIMDKDGMDIGARSISISTVGIPDGINKLANEFSQINLALSLHSADNKTRRSLMPINDNFDLAKLKRTLEKYIAKTNRKVFLEYIMIENVNDSVKNAESLIDFIKSFEKHYLLHVNLISYNDIGCGYAPSSKKQTHVFKTLLMKNSIGVTIRKSLGGEQNAACGQLAGLK